MLHSGCPRLRPIRGIADLLAVSLRAVQVADSGACGRGHVGALKEQSAGTISHHGVCARRLTARSQSRVHGSQQHHRMCSRAWPRPVSTTQAAPPGGDPPARTRVRGLVGTAEVMIRTTTGTKVAWRKRVAGGRFLLTHAYASRGKSSRLASRACIVCHARRVHQPPKCAPRTCGVLCA